jgi:plasmid maintenance system killer protein
MIIYFENEEIKLLVETGRSTDKRYRKLNSNQSFIRNLCKVISILRIAENTEFLKSLKSLSYERLKYDWLGYSSVRIGYNSKYRLIFEELDQGIKIKLIEINEHYGSK